MFKKLLIVPLFFVLGLALAQTGSIQGSIKDAETGEALIGATVAIKGTTKGSIADLDGNFLINKVPTGNHTVQISFVGYETEENEIEIKEGETTQLGETTLTSSAIGLKEVEVFASVVEDRKTPVAVSSISAQSLNERFSGSSLAEVVKNTPGVYSIQGAGGYGDNEVYIRGFNQSNVAFLINGIPINDMENGRMFWSNFAGLNEVTRQMQVQRGLGASKLAISSIGGTVNMITKPSERKEGGRIEYQTGTGSWNNRLRFTYHTGKMDGGWSASFQGSRTTTNGLVQGASYSSQGPIVPGAFTDAWSYYLAVTKEINDKHQLMFWGFGAPVNRGSAFVADDAMRTRYNLGDDERMNPALGIYKGEYISARQNKVNKPLMAISHYWDIDPETSLNTSVYFSHARVYSTQPRDANESTFIPQRTTAQNAAAGINDINANLATLSNGLINWDYFYDKNMEQDSLEYNYPGGNINQPVVSGRASRFYLESRHNDHDWIGLISNFKKSINDINLFAGVDLRHYKGIHYARVFETFGGDFVLNQNRYGDDYNKLEPGALAKKGDKYNYDYEGYVDWVAAFVQAEYNFDKFSTFITFTGTNTWYKRVGNYWYNQISYEANSVGKSETKSFFTYTAKAGISYSPTNRHKVFVNGGYFTRPPFFRSAFVDARYSNSYRPNLQVEKITTAEIGYSYRTSKLSANINGYYTIWKDRTTTFDVSGNVGNVGLDPGFEIPITFDGLESLHSGVEVDFTYNVLSNLELNGYLSLGDWHWNSNVQTPLTFTNEVGETDTDTVSVSLKGFRVGTTAQTTAGLGFHYRPIRNTYLGARGNYADRIAVRFSPEDVANGYITKEQIDNEFTDYYTIDIYAGRYFDITDDIRARLSVSVNNLLNEDYVRWASYFFSQFQRGYGYPRTYTIGLSVDF